MRLPRKELEPGEWQEEVNQYGGVRRYRMIGNCKEYEMDVTVDGITIVSIDEQPSNAEYEMKFGT